MAKENRREKSSSNCDWELLFDCAPSMLVLCDSKYKIRKVNRGFADFFGVNQRGVIGRRFLEVLRAPGLRLPNYARSKRKGASFEVLEARRGRFLEISVKPVKGVAAGNNCVEISLRDITYEKKAEESLRESEQKYKAIVDNTNDALFTHDFKGRITDANENACKLLGYSRRELIGKHFHGLAPQLSAKAAEKRLWEIERKGSLIFDEELVRKNKECIFVNVSAKVVSTPGAGLVQLFVRDITQRKKLEKKLEIADRATRLMLERSTEQGIFDVARDCSMELSESKFAVVLAIGPDGKARFVSESAGARKKLAGIEYLLTHVANEKAILVREHAVPSNGKGVNSFLGVPIRIAGESAGAIGVAERQGGYSHDDRRLLGSLADACASGLERVRAESMTRNYAMNLESEVSKRTADLAEEKQRVEDLSTVKDRFIRDIGHELKTPLGVMLANISLLREMVPEGREKEWELMLDLLQRNSERLGGSVQKILELTKLTNLEPRMGKVELKEIVDEVYSEQSSLAEIKGLDFKVDSKPTVVMGDSELMKLVVSNLVSNALKFTQRGKIRLSLRQAGKNAVLAVSDSGIGISREDQAKVFERFFKADPTAPGTGIGLSIANDIVEKYGGKISIKSTLGKGSTFTVILPRGVEK